MIKQAWISIYGNAAIADETITLLPAKVGVAQDDMPSADGRSETPPHAIVRSNVDFEQGSITWEAKLSEPSDRAQLMLPAETTVLSVSDLPKGESKITELSVGLNVLGAPYGFAIWNGAWDPAGGTGHGSSLPLDEWIPQKVTVRGSTIELYAHGVKVAATNCTLRRGQVGVLLQGNSGAAVRNILVVEDSPMCFAVMQFTEEFNILYKEVICPVCESYGYKVIRGDDFYTLGQIMEDITQSIRAAVLIIADVTPNNANVFYEVGYAHAIGKPTILLSDKKRERLPFDISGFRTLFYDNTIGGKAVVEVRLKQHLDALRPKPA